MSFVTLVRHGQANTHARDEASYDQLSDLGRQQARWLGDHLRATGEVFARAYCGTLERHVETAREMALDLEVVRDPRLNELEYFTMAQLLETQHGVAMPVDREAFVLHLPRVF
ncbi:MAG TPA: histidine phosphatase family protein, partial [Citreicella sp.]|nr:histidine phosphatase family protein [Citreicella sp.]